MAHPPSIAWNKMRQLNRFGEDTYYRNQATEPQGCCNVDGSATGPCFAPACQTLFEICNLSALFQAIWRQQTQPVRPIFFLPGRGGQ